MFEHYISKQTKPSWFIIKPGYVITKGGIAVGMQSDDNRQMKSAFSLPESTAVEQNEKYMLTAKSGADIQIAPGRIVDIKTKLLSCCPAKKMKTFLFTGTAHGVGVSTTVVSMATAMAGDSRKKVLLVDANFRTPGLHRAFDLPHHNGLHEILTLGDQKELAYKKVGPGNLYLFPSGVNHFVQDSRFESKRFDAFIEDVRKEFDYILIDAAPLNMFPDSAAICSRVDGVILVVTYGKTRRQVALRAKKELENAGAHILGVIINRRKFYIPKWIYRRL
jgi:capsular exopolysaccharide synthesis family protein